MQNSLHNIFQDHGQKRSIYATGTDGFAVQEQRWFQGVTFDLALSLCSPDVWYRRREPAQLDGEAPHRVPHSPDGHPEPLAHQRLQRRQHHQAVGRRPAAGGGTHHLRQRALLLAEQVSGRGSYLTVTCAPLQLLFSPQFRKCVLTKIACWGFCCRRFNVKGMMWDCFWGMLCRRSNLQKQLHTCFHEPYHLSWCVAKPQHPVSTWTHHCSSRYQFFQLAAGAISRTIFTYCKELGDIVHKVGPLLLCKHSWGFVTPVHCQRGTLTFLASELLVFNFC